MYLVFTFLACLSSVCLGLPTPGMLEDIAVEEGVQFSPKDIEFLAYCFEKLDQSQSSHSPVKFDGLKRNNGDGYDLRTGYFTAPFEGLYVFNFTSYATIKNRLRLMKNDYEVRILSKDGKGKGKRTTDENILLQLEGGDRVWLRLSHRKKNLVENTEEPDSTLTTFYGRLLTTDILIAEPQIPSGSSERTKRSTSDSTSLRLEIRNANYLPVSLVERTRRSTNIDTQLSGDHDVNGGSTNQKIAFSVTCTKSMIGGHMADTTESLDGEMSPDAAPNGRIGFDKTFVNVGDSFDIDNAEFIAPTSGVYFFSFNVGKFPRKKLSVMLMKNFNEVQSIIYNDSKGRAREIQGQSLMLQLRKGDRIWLRSYNDKDYAVYSNFGNYITFSGYLVYAM